MQINLCIYKARRKRVCYYQSKIILCSYLLINLVILQEMFLAKWNQNTVRSFVKKRFLFSSTSYKLISLLDMTSKHYANLLPISLVFQSQYSIAVLNYTVHFSIAFKKMLQEPQIFIPNLGKQPFLKLSCKCLILVPENRYY